DASGTGNTKASPSSSRIGRRSVARPRESASPPGENPVSCRAVTTSAIWTPATDPGSMGPGSQTGVADVSRMRNGPSPGPDDSPGSAPGPQWLAAPTSSNPSPSRGRTSPTVLQDVTALRCVACWATPPPSSGRASGLANVSTRISVLEEAVSGPSGDGGVSPGRGVVIPATRSATVINLTGPDPPGRSGSPAMGWATADLSP